MRLPVVLPLLFSIVAFILSMLTIFAGSRQGFIEDAAVITLNVSKIGQNLLEPNTTQANKDCNGGGMDLLDTAKCDISKVGAKIENALKDKIGDNIRQDINNLTRALGIYDFYSIHLLDYCEGYYHNSSTGNNAGKNVTHCSNRTALFDFDPKQTLQKQLINGVTLEDLGWPESLDDDIKDIRHFIIATFVLYCIGAGFAGLMILGCLAAIFSESTSIAMVDFIMSLLSFLALGIASAIATSAMNKAVHVINEDGKKIGVSAFKGTKFLGMTWAATALMLVSTLYFSFSVMKRIIHAFKSRGHGGSKV